MRPLLPLQRLPPRRDPHLSYLQETRGQIQSLVKKQAYVKQEDQMIIVSMKKIFYEIKDQEDQMIIVSMKDFLLYFFKRS